MRNSILMLWAYAGPRSRSPAMMLMTMVVMVPETTTPRGMTSVAGATLPSIVRIYPKRAGFVRL